MDNKSSAGDIHSFLNLMKIKKMYPTNSTNESIFTDKNRLLSPKFIFNSKNNKSPQVPFKSC